MRESMARLTPQFSASRAVREYTEQHYLPAAASYRERAANKGAVGKQVSIGSKQWIGSGIHCASETCGVETNADHHIFQVELVLNNLDPNTARVELYADGIGGNAPCDRDERVGQLANVSGGYVYSAAVSAARPPADYTPRVILSVPE